MTGMLQGQVALISGAGPGLGRDTALVFAREGATVALLARKPETTRPIADEVKTLGGKAITIAADITKPEDGRRAAKETIDQLGKIDILVNVAFRDDAPNRKSLLDSDDDLADWRRIFEVNVFGTLLMTKAVLPHMVERRRGNIVMVNSMTAERVLAKAGSYSGSKSALQRASQCLALEVAEYKIRVNSIHPGYMWNDFVQGNAAIRAERNGTTVDQEKAKILTGIPLGYIAETSEYARTILYLASDMSGPLTGQSIHINGGQFIR